jgi:GH25 family lysozyme M1 (1,4-beta-N-acetylmuramidase)
MSVQGIDISTFQKGIKFKDEKPGFAMIRAGFERTLDSQMANHVKECEKYNIPYGFYWFSYACNPKDARAEANFFLPKLKKYQPLYPIAFDYENSSREYAQNRGYSVTRQAATDIMRAALEEIEKAGFYAANYSNLDWFRNRWHPAQLKRYDLWVAAYTNTQPSFNTYQNYGIWQKSDKGRIKGYSGNVDVDIAYKDYPNLIRKAHLNGF